ncbi:hypothetical protein SEA_LILPHARAOH_71 [Mycobacterium phage LilPharaoh]|uniref:Uncharacterized protein n=1 Tax=Mycobacterium phage Amelie TaxID=1913035 RepID=A0A1J0GQ60_9CAUD|nr:hypothetical protein AVV01_gp72 [Mycobacterium phage Enkosi]YP_009952588.1 hypothetical protein I5G92_gp70 [Mycobacterium phage Amelie]ATN90524.1 hypothetical protein SEA_LILPHARAOH_71 [Mycobacterium phage LilPharaoh]AVP42648.1 hypothetical protein SEA_SGTBEANSPROUT_71 [Mycobacterium phage SgtBeansprout]AXC37176.1 hypothetical protein SEA_BIGLEBOPS_70 [Mycobacterium phage Biglebops]QGJ93355.1 hypothetical protein PBI_MDAVU_71 [Mycobacterium phage Mdavu]UQS94470.1 hypothetical protein SEA_N
MSDVVDTRLSDLSEAQRERLRRSLERFNEALRWQLKHAEDELKRERLRRLFG